ASGPGKNDPGNYKDCAYSDRDGAFSISHLTKSQWLTPPPGGYSEADYLIGWICILPEEYLAAKAVLDQQYDFYHIARGRNDRMSYTLGRMGQHPVVINQPPSSLYGEIHASAIAHSMKSTFAKIWFVLLLGIGGGVPQNGHDIRVGDVVLGEKVIPYASGKNTIFGFFGFEITGRMAYPPPPDPLCCPDWTRKKNQIPWTQYLQGPSCDCLQYEKQRFAYMISRPPCVGDLVKVHKGSIGSAGAVVKNADVRDDLATRENLICFEMEAAGVMSTMPCLPVRGISDYSDSHKNDAWHQYAALAAAVYAKEILGTLTISDVMRSPLELDDGDIAEYMKDATREFA
ncbi:nucleoside phosphorylase domain-containing protein, partial [Penicillium malachiteum]